MSIAIALKENPLKAASHTRPGNHAEKGDQLPTRPFSSSWKQPKETGRGSGRDHAPKPDTANRAPMALTALAPPGTASR